jgi:hypothetical protein
MMNKQSARQLFLTAGNRFLEKVPVLLLLAQGFGTGDQFRIVQIRSPPPPAEILKISASKISQF